MNKIPIYIGLLLVALSAIGGMASENLIVNGDFESGDTGFYTDYRYLPLYIYETAYNISTDPKTASGFFTSFGDHTSGSGLMMIVNGALAPNTIVWSQTVAVVPNTNYNYSAWIAGVYPASPAQLQFIIDSDVIGTITAPSTPGIWQEFATTWNSGSRTSATVKIIDLNTNAGGNDFAMDDISLMNASTQTNEPPIAEAGGPYTTNEGVSITLDASGSYNPSGGALTYAWNLTNGSIFSIRSIGPQLTVRFPDGPRARTIALKVTNANGLSSTDTAIVNVLNVNPVVEAGPDQTINAGDIANFKANFSDVQPDMNRSTAQINYGDGTAESVVANPNGTIEGNHPYTNSGTYIVTITVTDKDGGIGSDTLTVTVKNISPIPEAGGPYTANEGSVIQFDGSASSDPDGDPLTYVWDFGDVSTASEVKPTHTYADNGIYTVTLTVSDTHGTSKTANTTATINNIPPTVNAGSGATINEGDTFSSSGSFSDPAPVDSKETWTATVDYGDGSGIQPLTLSDKTFALSHTYVDNGVYSVTVTVTDNAGEKGSNTATVTVNNVAPLVTITDPAVGSIYAVNTPITFTGSYTDPGTLDTHTAQWTLDSTTTPVQSVSGGSVSTSYTFTAPGVYLVKLTVTDKDGGVGTATTVNGQNAFVVVYDPNGGFVTGGGWINSPVGAYIAYPSLTGRANFGFVSKYQKGATVPTGETEFQFQAGDLNFHSTSYDWLVVAGAKAQYKGSGTINGAGNYGFMLTAIDGAISGGGGTDKFRIKIVNKDNGAIVYDNQLNADDSADPTTVIQGGSIIIHS